MSDPTPEDRAGDPPQGRPDGHQNGRGGDADQNGRGGDGSGQLGLFEGLPPMADYPTPDGPSTVPLPVTPGLAPDGPDEAGPGSGGNPASRRPRRSARRRTRQVDVLVIGAGPAGLAAATALCQAGVGSVEVVEREQEAGGIPRHCRHTGYAIRDLHRLMTGPDYARWLVAQAGASGAEVRTGVSVTGWATLPRAGEPLQVETTSQAGLERVAAGAVVLATGARERPRAARLVPGGRGQGVLTTGLLQQLVYLYQQPVGRRAVVVGAEHVSFSALLTLKHAGVEVAAMVTDQPRHQTWSTLRFGTALRFGVRVLSSTTVQQVVGRYRVEGVEVRRASGRVQLIECDTVVFTGDWVPDHELARMGGLAIDPGTRGPRVDTALRTSQPGVFAVGNLVHPVQAADITSLRARQVAAGVVDHLAGRSAPARVGVEVAGALGWVSPNLVSPQGPKPPRGGFLLWPTGFARWARITVSQGERVLYSTRAWRMVPNRPHRLDPRWLAEVDTSADADPVTISG